MTPMRLNDRRLVLRMLEYWSRVRAERDFPSVKDIDPAEIADDWSNCLLVEVGFDSDLPTFRYVGQDLSIPEWAEAAGHAIAECPVKTLLRIATSYIPKVLERRAPESVDGQTVVRDGMIMYRSILLPLSTDGVRIDTILGAANCLYLKRYSSRKTIRRR